MNNWGFTGNLGKDAEVRYTPNGAALAGFSVATKSGFGDKEQTLWVDVTLWGKRGESLAPYLVKGQQVAVCGELSTREYEGKTYLQVRADQVSLVGKKSDNQNSAQSNAQADGFRDKPAEQSEFDDDDIPF